jgi:predicted HTH transcriptional regulator
LIKTTFHEMGGKDVCRVIAKPSPKPIYVRDGIAEHLYIRVGNSTRQLTTKEAVEYCERLVGPVWEVGAGRIKEAK